jgi:hypothetical protein
MSTPLTFLLFGSSVFVFLAVISIVRGVKVREKAYCVSGLACVLLAFWLALLYFGQLLFGFGFFAAGAIIGLANYSRSTAAASRETVNQQTQTDLSKPLKPAELFSWGGWFKIAARWGNRTATIFYALFNLAFIMILPALLLLFNVGSASVTVLSIVAVIGVLASSVAIFNQQIIKNLKTKQ